MHEKLLRECAFALAITLSGTFVSCDDDDSKQKDQVAPTVSFQNLDNEQEVSGTLSIKIDASDNRGIVSVKFFIDNILAKTLTTPPYEFDFDTRTIDNGVHMLKVVATDKAGNEQTQEVEVTVTNATQDPVTLLTIQVAADYLGTDGKPSKGFVVLHDEDWKVISSATVANGETLTLSSDRFDGTKFTVTELQVYESESSAYLSATSYLNVPKGHWVLVNNEPDTEVKSVKVSFNMFTEGFGYGVSSNASLSSVNSNVFVDITNPFATHLDLSESPGKLFVRQYYNDGHNKFFMYEHPEIRDGGEYQIDFSVLDNAPAAHELISELVDFPKEGIVHLYGLPDAASTTVAYYLGQFIAGEDKIWLQYPAAAVSPFAGYYASTQFTTANGAVAYNSGFGKFNTTPLAAGVTVEGSGETAFVSTSGQFDFFMTHCSLGAFGDGTWFVIGPPINNRKLKVFELPEPIATELAFIDFDASVFDQEFFLTDFAEIENYDGLLELINGSEGGFPEAINLLEEKNLMIDISRPGLTKRKDYTRGRRIRDTFMNHQ